MSSIDERIVQMKFDNDKFEQGVKSTIQSLAQLKSSLNFEGSTVGMEKLSDFARKFSLENIATSISDVGEKFNAMAGVAIVALGNIATQAIQTGLSIAKSLTIAPITAGFNEYELKMGSIQTILANTSKYGTTLDDVNKALDDLNTYSDKTIYNFGQMTKNIGLFTNAGIRLEDATSMIKGFSNAAAASGVTAENAAGAAYQLSQALSSGTVRLMDWRSLTNAGMGGANMKQGLVDLASAMGVLGKNTPQSIMANFNDSLKSGWLSADVMSKYLRIMAGDMTETQMKALGMSDSMIKNFMAQQKTAEEAATKIRTYTQLLNTAREAVGSTWSETFTILLGNFQEATDLFTGINDAFSKMVSESGDARNNLLKDWKKLGGRTDLIEALGNVFKALGSIFEQVGKAFSDVFPPTTAKQLYNITATFKAFSEKLKASEETLNNLKRIFRGVLSVFGIFWEIIKAVTKAIFSLFGTVGSGSGGFLKLAGNIGDVVYNLYQAIKSGDKLGKFFSGIANIIRVPIALLQSFFKVFSDLVEGIKSVGASSENIKKVVGQSLNNFGSVGDALQKIWNGIVDIFSKLMNFIKPVTDAIGSAFEGLPDIIKNAFGKIHYDTILSTLNTGLFIGLFMGLKKIIAHGLKIDLTGGFFDKLNQIFQSLTGTLVSFQNSLKAKTLLSIAAALGIIALSAIMLAGVDPVKLTSALSAITVMLVQLMFSLSVFSKVSKGIGVFQLNGIAFALITLGIAIAVLTSSVIRLSKLSWEELSKGLIGVTVLIGGLILASKLINANTKGLFKAGIALIAMSIAIAILSNSVKMIGQLPINNIIAGVTAIGALLLEIAIFQALQSKNKIGMANALAMLVIANAIKVMSIAITQLGAMSIKSLTKGLTAIGMIFAMIIAFNNLTKGSFVMIMGVGLELTLIASSLKNFVAAIKDLGNMSWENLIKGLFGIAAVLTTVSLVMRIMPTDMVFKVISLLILAQALVIMTQALKGMGSLTWEQIGKGLLVLASSLVILGIALTFMSGTLTGSVALMFAALALSLIVPAVVSLSKLKWSEVAVGLTTLAVALAIITAAGIALYSTGAVLGLLGLGAAALLVGVGLALAGAGVLMFATGIGVLAAALGIGGAVIVGFIASLLDLIPIIMKKLAEGIVEMAKVIGESGPVLISAITVLLVSLITAIMVVTPMLVKAIMDLIWILLDALVKNIPRFVDAGMTIIISFLEGITKKLPDLMNAATNLIVKFVEGIGKNASKIVNAGIKTVIDFVDGVANGVGKYSKKFVEAGSKLFRAIVDGIAEAVKQGNADIDYAGVTLGNALIDAAKHRLGINSPSKEFYKIGTYVVDGLVNGVKDTINTVKRTATNLGTSAISGLNKSIAKIATITMSNIDTNPVIKPVLDLDAIRKDASLINSIINPNAISINSSYVQAANIATQERINAAEQAATVDTTQQSTTQVTFIQNNTSPKALSASEIYRQTKNQISIAKNTLAT